MKKSLWSAVIACVLFATPVTAKEGFYLGAFFPTESISGDAGENLDSGSGWGLRAGFGLNRYVSFEGKFSRTEHDVKTGGGSSVDFDALAADVKLNFPLTSLDRAQVMTLEPYLLAGYAHYEASNGTTHKSDGFQWGFGIELYLFRELSVQAGWTRSEVSFDTTPEAKGNVKTVDVGLIYHFL